MKFLVGIYVSSKLLAKICRYGGMEFGQYFMLYTDYEWGGINKPTIHIQTVFIHAKFMVLSKFSNAHLGTSA